MSGPSLPEPSRPAHPEPIPSEDERQQVIDRIQQALAEDQIEFNELDQRFAAVYAATTRAELLQVVSDLPAPRLPPPPVTARHPAPSSQFSLIGDVEVGGWVTMDETLTMTSLIGDATIDLSSASFGPDGLVVTARSLVGDVKVIVPDGARVQIDAFMLVGDKRQNLSPPIDGGPLIRINVLNLIGDVKVYSLSLVPEGRLRQLWSKFRAR